MSLSHRHRLLFERKPKRLPHLTEELSPKVCKTPIVSQNQREMWEIGVNSEQHNHWQPENPLHKRTFARRFCTFERQAESAFRAFLASVHTRKWAEGSTEARELPYRLLFLPVFNTKKRI